MRESGASPSSQRRGKLSQVPHFNQKCVSTPIGIYCATVGTLQQLLYKWPANWHFMLRCATFYDRFLSFVSNDHRILQYFDAGINICMEKPLLFRI
jgi:hypothetical protein